MSIFSIMTNIYIKKEAIHLTRHNKEGQIFLNTVLMYLALLNLNMMMYQDRKLIFLKIKHLLLEKIKHSTLCIILTVFHLIFRIILHFQKVLQ